MQCPVSVLVMRPPRSSAAGIRLRTPPPASRGVRVVLRLPLAELEPLPRARLARLLALDRARVPRQQAAVAQLLPVRLIHVQQRPGDPEPQRTPLPRHPAAVHARFHYESAER